MNNAIINFIRRIFGLSPKQAPEQTQTPESGAVYSTPFDTEYFLRNPGPVVYLIQHGERPEYKIGLTENINTRVSRIGLLMPEPVHLVHCIYTNDPKWLEDIWHKHFAGKRKFGSGKRRASEWFELADIDVQEFKNYKEWNNPAINFRHQLLFPVDEEEKSSESKAKVCTPSPRPVVNVQPAPRISVPSPSPVLPSRLVADAIGRVNAHFDKSIAAHPDRAAKLVKSRNWELSQIETEIRFWCGHGYNEAQALAKWEERARKSADAKTR